MPTRDRVVCGWRHRADDGSISHVCGLAFYGPTHDAAFRAFQSHVARCHPPCHPKNERRYLAAHPGWAPINPSRAEQEASTRAYNRPAAAPAQPRRAA